MQLFTALLSALALVSSATASPAPAAIRRSELIVVTPAITQPSPGTTWLVGTTQNIMWDTSNIPPSGKNNHGVILLGFNNGTGSENLNISHPLASNFLLTNGIQNVTVPNVPAKTTYFVVLIGDSGNKSPQFTIAHP